MLESIQKILPLPWQVGSSEYQAIYELIEDAENLDLSLSICDEFINQASAIRERISKIP